MKYMVLSFLFALLAACGGNSLHKPTTTGNAGMSAVMAYSLAGIGVGEYLALPLCPSPAVYPCKTQATNDSLVKANAAAYKAALAADAAGNDPAAQAKAKAATDALAKAKADPYIAAQIKLAQQQEGAIP